MDLPGVSGAPAQRAGTQATETAIGMTHATTMTTATGIFPYPHSGTPSWGTPRLRKPRFRLFNLFNPEVFSLDFLH